MKAWMKIFLSAFFFYSVDTQALCELKKDFRVVSFSGTATVLFQELGLLHKVSGISVFNPVSSKDYKGKIYPGGIFLSEKSLKELQGSVLFHDESRELKRIFSKASMKAFSVNTRQIGPLEVNSRSLQLISGVLSGCEDKFKLLKLKAYDLLKKIKTAAPKGRTIVFYLGEIRNGRYPELLMVQDGIVKTLISENVIKTYPTQLAYVNWSAKIMRGLPEDTLHVALKDSGMNGDKEIQKSPQGVTLQYPGVLTPGISQLEGFSYLFERL